MVSDAWAMIRSKNCFKTDGEILELSLLEQLSNHHHGHFPALDARNKCISIGVVQDALGHFVQIIELTVVYRPPENRPDGKYQHDAHWNQ